MTYGIFDGIELWSVHQSLEEAEKYLEDLKLVYPLGLWALSHEVDPDQLELDAPYHGRPDHHRELKWASVGLWDGEKLVNWRRSYCWLSEVPSMPDHEGDYTLCRFVTTYEDVAQRLAKKRYRR